MDDLIPNTGAVNLIADNTDFVFAAGTGKTWSNIAGVDNIANFNFVGFAGWHRLHHDGGVAKYLLEARSTTAAGGGPP